MRSRQIGLLQTYRLLREDPVKLWRIGKQEKFTLERTLFNNFAMVTAPEHVKHVLVTNADNYRKTPIHRALLGPIVGNGLVNSDGDFWKRQRRIAAPAFHHKRIKTFANPMVEAALEMLDDWRQAVAENRPIDVLSEMSRVTMKIITRSMFSAGLRDEDARGVSDAIQSLNGYRMRFRDFIGLPEWLPRLRSRAERDAVRRIDGIVNRIIAERRADGGDHGDLLSMLVLARDEDTGEGMSDRQLRDEVVTVFLAGHETTATALAWTFFALDRNRHVERRLQEELDSVLTSDPPCYEDLERMPYARMVIEETMRLYPTVPQITRQAIGEDRIDGVRVPPGTIINLNMWLAHRDPKIWEDPRTFDPERFTPERSANRPKFAYFPFGGGGRVCIGSGFAMLEARLILATVARAYTLRLVKGHPVRPIGNVVLHPKGGLPMYVQERKRT